MVVELKPEIERLLKEEISQVNFPSVDELIVQGVYAWREKHQAETLELKPRKKLYDKRTQPPFAGSKLTIERQKDDPRPIDLG